MGFFSNILAKKEAIFIQGNDTYTLEIVEESNHQNHLKRVCGGYSKEGSNHEETAELHYHKKKSESEHSIRVIIKKKPVGYLSSDDAKRYKKRLKRLGEEGIVIQCNAKIFGGTKLGLFDRSSFEVWLDLSIEDFIVERKAPMEEELLPVKGVQQKEIQEDETSENISEKPTPIITPIDL